MRAAGEPDLQVLEVRDDELVDLADVPEDLLVAPDLAFELEPLGLELLVLERRQPREPHVEDRVRLALGEPELRDERGAGGRDVGRLLDRLDDLVDAPDRDQEAEDDVQPLLGLASSGGACGAG